MIIEVDVSNKIAQVRDRTIVGVCGNSDYVIHFNFDDEWSAYENKTARFKWGGTFTDVVFTGNECPMPIIYDTNTLEIGVYAGELHTTTAAVLYMKKSVLCGNASESKESQELKDNMNKILAEKVDVPQTASVGDVLTVEEVDDNGKPTKWKAATVEIPDVDGVVKYDAYQDLTDTQKSTARHNIGSFPGKRFRYFYDTTVGSALSEHTDDIFGGISVGDVISPGNIYTDGAGHTNTGMSFPAYVIGWTQLDSWTYQVQLFDANSAVWQVVYSRSGNVSSGIYDIAKLSTETLTVSITSKDDDTWTADVPFDNIITALNANKVVVGKVDYDGMNILPCVSWNDTCVYFCQTTVWDTGMYRVAVEIDNDVGVSINDEYADFRETLPFVHTDEWEMEDDAKAQARQNIGAVSDKLVASIASFNDFASVPSGQFGIFTGVQMGNAPADFSAPAIYIVGFGERGVYPITFFDANGVVWKGSQSRGALTEFTRVN